MIKKMIENYIYNMKNIDVKNFALKNDIILNDNEVEYILNVIKKNYHILIYGNPELIFNDLKNKFPDYKENKFLKFGKAKKQSLKIRLAVETMMFFNKIGIDKFVYRIISLL